MSNFTVTIHTDKLLKCDIEVLDKFTLLCKQKAAQYSVVDDDNFNLPAIADAVNIPTSTYNKDGIFTQNIWLRFLLIVKDNIAPTEFKYNSIEDFKRAYMNSSIMFSRLDEVEIEKLKNTANWMHYLLKKIPAKKNKGLAMNIIPKVVEGIHTKYCTGSGQTKATADRVTIFETEGGVHAIKRQENRVKDHDNEVKKSLKKFNNKKKVCKSKKDTFKREEDKKIYKKNYITKRDSKKLNMNNVLIDNGVHRDNSMNDLRKIDVFTRMTRSSSNSTLDASFLGSNSLTNCFTSVSSLASLSSLTDVHDIKATKYQYNKRRSDTMTTNESADTDDDNDSVDIESANNMTITTQSPIKLSISPLDSCAMNNNENIGSCTIGNTTNSCAEKMFIDEDFVDCLSLFRDSSANSALNSVNGASSNSKFQQLLSRTNSSCSNSIFGSGNNLLSCSNLSSMSLSNFNSQDELNEFNSYLYLKHNKDNHWGSNLSLVSNMDASELTSPHDQFTPFSTTGQDFVDFISDFSISPRSPRSPRNLVSYDKATND